MIYYTADLHFGHKSIIKYENRPFKDVEQMDKVLIKLWNSRIGPEDDVYVLGDFCLKGATKAIEYLKLLNGRIHLIRGNHDHFVDQFTYKYHSMHFFGVVKDEGYYTCIKDNEHKVILCHYPLLYWENMEQGSIHLYGHCHNYRDCSKMASNSYNVGVDVNNYAPVTLEELISKGGNK